MSVRIKRRYTILVTFNLLAVIQPEFKRSEEELKIK